MFNVSRALPANPPGASPRLTRADVWHGLELKAANALPFVPSISYCVVTERISETQFVREIEFRGERSHERVTLEPQTRVTFERLDGSVRGRILNEIEEADGELALRFTYSGFPADRLEVIPDLRAALDRGLALVPPGGELGMLPTYTAMLELRKIAVSRGLVRPYWEDAS